MQVLYVMELTSLLSQVDDILDTKLDQQFKLVMDKGTLDAIGLHPDGPVKRYPPQIAIFYSKLLHFLSVTEHTIRFGYQ